MGDLITLNTENELNEAFNISKELEKKTLRIFIIEEKAEEKTVPMACYEVRYQNDKKTLKIPQGSLKFDTLTEIGKLYPSLQNNLLLKYMDDEDDLVTIKEDHELEEASKLMDGVLVFVVDKIQ